MRAFTGEDLSPRIGNEDVVLESNAEFARDVDAGFDREDLADLEFLLGVLSEEGSLVHFEADSVSASVSVDG